MSDKSSSLKWVSLVVLIAQTTALVLVMRYSRTHKIEGQPQYLSSTAILSAEIVKFFSCLLVIFGNSNWSWHRFENEFNRDVFKNPSDTLKVGVPALCYVIQNNLLFYALSKLDAATYQVTYQLKILTTAFFAVLILGRKLIALKWISLIMLTVGVALVQLPKEKVALPSATLTDDNAEAEAARHFEKWSGFLALLAACFLSGFSGIYMEKLLKHANVSLWMRNTQLAFFSIFGAFFMVWLYDMREVNENGFFQGYNWVIWTVVLLQAYGGLLISLVVKYADNILKGFAVSLSILLSSFVSWQFLNDFEPSLAFILGATIVVASSFLYGYEPKKSVVAPKGLPHTSMPTTPLHSNMSHDELKKLGHYS